MMSPRELYLSREAEFSAIADRLRKLSDRLSMVRLAVFVGGMVLFAILLSVSVITAVATLTVALITFAWLVIKYETTERSRKRYLHLAEINRLELKCLDGDFSGFKTGDEYAERDHSYSYDLDIFGKASLFQYICRTTSRPASDRLALYLKQPATKEEILLRQEAAGELQPMTDWRQELMTLGYLNAGAGSDPAPLMQWLESDDLFRKTGREKIITASLSLMGLTAVILVITGLPAAILVPVFVVNFLFYFTRFKRISKLQEQVSRSSDLLKAYSAIIRLIENRNFASPLLQKVQSAFTSGISASHRIRQLSKLVGRLDSRLNVLVSLPLNLLFFSDIHFCLALERWKRGHASLIPGWFAAMAEFEVLASLGNMAFNNPGWVFPKVTEDYFVFRAEEMGHPLIPAARRKSNDFAVDGAGRAIIVTGSNMSGKSTFLRTCGVNAVLAFAGDGVNDAPALLTADVGVCMPGGADLARESAQVVLLEDNLMALAVARDIATRTRRVLTNSFRAAVGVNSAVMLLAAGGKLSPVAAAMMHNASTLGILGYAALAGGGSPKAFSGRDQCARTSLSSLSPSAQAQE